MRKVHASLILAGLLIAFSGCNGKSKPNPGVGPAVSPSQASAGPNPSGTATPDPERQHDPNDRRPVLVCFGDSLTAGYGTGPGQSYPDYLQADLDKLDYHYRVDNEGVSGNTTKDGVERLPEILALHPVVAVVEFGGNDGLRGLPIEQSRINLDQIVATLKSAGIKVALAGITLPPDYGEDYIKQFDDTYSVLAKKYRVPMLPFLLQDVYGVPGMMQEDHTHATAKGNVIVARNVVSLVLPLLKK